MCQDTWKTQQWSPIRQVEGREDTWNPACDAYKLLWLWATHFMILNFYNIPCLQNRMIDKLP